MLHAADLHAGIRGVSGSVNASPTPVYLTIQTWELAGGVVVEGRGDGGGGMVEEGREEEGRGCKSQLRKG